MASPINSDHHLRHRISAKHALTPERLISYGGARAEFRSSYIPLPIGIKFSCKKIQWTKVGIALFNEDLKKVAVTGKGNETVSTVNGLYHSTQNC